MIVPGSGVNSLYTRRKQSENGGYMRQLQGSKYILFALLACMAVTISSAAIADQELLSLVPPGAQGVTRIGSPNPSALVGHFVLTSRNNGIDYNDFLALTGADGTLVVH